MKKNNYHIVYFIGIGGIGMSALAKWFKLEGKTVLGYDRAPSALTEKMLQDGIDVHYEDEISHIPKSVKNNKENTLVVYTPAVPKDHKEFNYFVEQGYVIKKRSEVLGMLTEDKYTIAVAGTHGKTTTSSMVIHILNVARCNSVGFIGGVLQDYESNLVIYGKPGKETIVVAEADEFDRSFLRLNPDTAVVTSMDADHLDIYDSTEALKQSFNDFINKIRKGGRLFIHDKVATAFSDNSNFNIATYSLDKGAYRAENVRVNDGKFVFDFNSPSAKIKDVTLSVPGFHNVENAIAAIAVTISLQIDTDVIKKAVASYKGVKRRFEYIIKNDDLVYIDDYAHHPKEIESLIKSVKALYPQRKITVIFQPHLYSRTRDFADAFATPLSLADEVILLNIYPARELPIKGVSSRLIMDKMVLREKILIEDEHLLETLEGRQIDVLLTVGAGNIDRFVAPIRKLLGERRFYA